MRLKDGRYAPGYNVQVTADLETGAIVHAEVIDQGNDSGQLQPQLEQAEAALVKAKGAAQVVSAVADSAYHDTRQLVALEGRGIQCVVPEERNTNRTPPGVSEGFRAEAFVYDAESDTLVCPAGATLAQRKMNNTQTSVVYQARATSCAACPHKPQCCPNTKAGRSVNRSAYCEELAQVAARVATAHGQSLLRARWTALEGLLARVIDLLGFRRCRTWGRKGVIAELRWRQLTHNLMLLIGKWRPLVYQLIPAA